MDKIKGNRYLTTTILAIVLILSTIVQSNIKPANSSDPGPTLANPDLFKVELYADFGTLPGNPKAFHLNLVNEESGFPKGLYVTTDFTRASQLLRVDGPNQVTVVTDGLGLNEATILAKGDYGNGLLITEIADLRIRRLLTNGTKATFTSLGTAPLGPAGMTYHPDGTLLVADFSSGKILRVAPDGTSQIFASLPDGAVSHNKAIHALPSEFAARFGGPLLAGTFHFTGDIPLALDKVYVISGDGQSVIQVASGFEHLEFLTPGPGGAFGSGDFAAEFGTDAYRDGRVSIFNEMGTVTSFLTGIDATHVVFDTERILGGGMFIADIQSTPEGELPGRIWRVTERVVGGISVLVDKFGLLAPYIGLASTILVATAATAIYVKRVNRRKEKQ